MKKAPKKIILIGRSAAGKTTLCQYIGREELRYLKTPTVQVLGRTMIDTPGEYLERSCYRGALQVSSADADIIVLVQDATDRESLFPPAYSSAFSKPVVGVVTKSDLADAVQLRRAELFLKNAGAREIFITSSINGKGFEEFLKFLGYE